MKDETYRTSLWLTAPIAILLAIAAGAGMITEGLYRDVPDIVAQAKGQDLISLILVLPILIVTAILARRGSLQARLIWLGALTYLVYTYASFAFAIQYNPLFLVYIALLGFSLYALIGGLATLDMAEVKARYIDQTSARAASIFLSAAAVLISSLWLSEIIPALIAGEIPQSILEDRTPTNVVHVLDLAWILPSFGIAAASLWRKHALGYILAGILLPYFVLIVSAILSMGLLQAQAGTPDVLPMIIFFGTLLVTGAGILAWYLNGLYVPTGVERRRILHEP